MRKELLTAIRDYANERDGAAMPEVCVEYTEFEIKPGYVDYNLPRARAEIQRLVMERMVNRTPLKKMVSTPLAIWAEWSEYQLALTEKGRAVLEVGND